METTSGTNVRSAPKNGSYRDFLRNSHLFSSAFQKVVEEQYLRQVTDLPLNTTHVHLIQLMANHGAHLVGETATFLGVSPAAASKTVTKLVNLGLIQRMPHESDRRAARVTITPKGRTLVKRLEEEKARGLEPALDQMSPDDLEKLNAFLERISLFLLEKGNGGAGLCLKCGAYCSDTCAFRGRKGVCPYGHRKCG